MGRIGKRQLVKTEVEGKSIKESIPEMLTSELKNKPGEGLYWGSTDYRSQCLCIELSIT
jgi:hypothetical protein